MNRLFGKCIVFVILCGMLLPVLGYGATLSYQYDNLNRLTKVRYESGTVISYSYDPAGNRLSRIISQNNVVLKGDINGDDLVNLTDAIQGLQILIGLKPASIRSDYAESGADAAGNQKIGLEEVIYILQTVAGIRQN